MKRAALLAACCLLLTGCLAPKPAEPSEPAESTAPTAAPTASALEVELTMLRSLPTVESAQIVNGWPTVVVARAEDLAGAQKLLVTLALWADGGTLWAEQGRVRLTELPDSLTPRGYAEIIDASVAYPGAQFWLEAPTTGHGWPQLFVDQVSVDEAAGVQAALSGPFDAAPSDVPYFIRATTATGYVDSAGVLGRS